MPLTVVVVRAMEGKRFMEIEAEALSAAGPGAVFARFSRD